MNKAARKNIFIVLLLILTILIVFIYILSLRKQVVILDAEKQNLLQDLEKGKQLQQKLSQENAQLKENLVASKKKITKLLVDYSAEHNSLEDLKSKFSILQAENTALREDKEKVSREIVDLQAKLGSVAGLKKAIVELRRQMHKVGRQIRQKAEVQESIEGNRGYIIKDGKPTYPARIKIEVLPAPAQ